MQQTLFYIPHWFLQGPLPIIWLIGGLVVLIAQVRRHGWTGESLNFLSIWLIGAAFLWLVVPRIEVYELDPADPGGPPVPAGLAVRGYGVMVLAGLIVGVALTVYRARREGLNPDRVLTAIFVAVIFGIAGARLFYVIQKFDEFIGQPPLQALGDMINVTEGGLVVYGSLIGGGLAGWWYMRRAQLPILKLADISAPGMLIGLSLGRIGCLLNGCCFGGVCEMPSIATTFPAGAPAYMRQLHTGELLGVQSTHQAESGEAAPESDAGWRFAESVEAGSLAEQAGVQTGEWFRVELPATGIPLDKFLRLEKSGAATGLSMTVRQRNRVADIPLSQLPDRSLAVTPAQLLASINALLLAAVLWFYFPLRRYDGRVFAMMLILYAVTRFLLEIIRHDEFGVFGTSLTISQWVSIGLFIGGVLLFATARQRVGQVSFQPAAST